VPAKPAASPSLRPSVGQLFEEFVAVQARLRAPGGCPWDREQTHASLKTFLIEETYEVLDALENGNPRELSEELGDLLLQVLFHADLAREAAEFDISDVIVGIRDKMIRRHPHVFGDAKVASAGEVLKNWAQIKAEEKLASRKDSLYQLTKTPSALEGIPRSLPALLEAYQLTRVASRIGFDWESRDGIFEKLLEEFHELQVALDIGDKSDIEEELGDLLFICVNISRFLGFDPEVVLKHSNLKFKHRFQHMEREAAGNGQGLANLSKDELEALWDSAKLKFKKSPPFEIQS
jgi:tetrapyrrole methylase family protein/MazG family protein